MRRMKRKPTEQSKAKKKRKVGIEKKKKRTKEENAEPPTRSQLSCARYQYAIFLVKAGPKRDLHLRCENYGLLPLRRIG
jgi:hypothetical protein